LKPSKKTKRVPTERGLRLWAITSKLSTITRGLKINILNILKRPESSGTMRVSGKFTPSNVKRLELERRCAPPSSRSTNSRTSMSR